jgi:hypothetical protein
MPTQYTTKTLVRAPDGTYLVCIPNAAPYQVKPVQAQQVDTIISDAQTKLKTLFDQNGITASGVKIGIAESC